MTSNGKVLLWCEEPLLGKSIRHFLENKIYEVVACKDFEEVVTALRMDDYQLLVTDCPYPDRAYDLLLKKFPDLELFCAAQQPHVIPPEYMSGATEHPGTMPLHGNISMHRQPFNLAEILHCLQKQHKKDEECIQLGKKYELIPAKSCLRFKKKEQKIPAKELHLLLLLVKNHPDIVSKDLIAQKLWPGDTQDHSNSINVYINNLRKYFLEDSGIHIESMYHKGVRLYIEE